MKTTSIMRGHRKWGLLALLAVALALGWGHKTAEAVGPEMSLGATGNVTCDTPSKPTKCTAEFNASDPKAGEFQITVDANVFPVGGYAGFHSEIFGICDPAVPQCLPGRLDWNRQTSCIAEVVWPDEGGGCVNTFGGEAGQAQHRGLTAAAAPFPKSNFTGTLVRLNVHCPAEGSFKVTLTAAPSRSIGAQYLDTSFSQVLVKTVVQQLDVDGDTIPETLDVADTLTVNCLPPGVGGIAELPEVAGISLRAEGSSVPSASVVAGIAGAVAAGAIALGGAAWYARKRWVR